jgi:DNA-binding NtrC family response regulator
VAAALESFDEERPSAVSQDVNLPDGSGLDALLEYKKRKPQAIVIMITGNVQLEDTIAALRGRAYDFIARLVRLGELQVTIRNGIEADRLRREARYLRLEQERRFSFDQIIGESPAMAEMIRLARKVAASSDVITADWLPRGMTGDERTVVLKPVVSIS